MANFVIVICCLAITSITAAPASNEQLDKEQRFSNSASITREKYKNYRKYGQYQQTIPYGDTDSVVYRETDWATVNDVAVNTVEDNSNKQVEPLVPLANPSSSTVEISGITTGAEAPASSTPAVEQTPFKPQRAGSIFARLIDDIFQIPITVLQNVARLITSPFTQARKNPEVLAPVS